MDTSYFLRDTIVVKMFNVTDSVSNAVNTTPVKTNVESNIFDLLITLSICIAIVVVVLVITKSIFRWYKFKEDERTKREKENDENERKESMEAKWFSLKKDYQDKMLCYLDKTSEKNYDIKDDSYLSFVKDCINQIDEKINLPHLSNSEEKKASDGQIG